MTRLVLTLTLVFGIALGCLAVPVGGVATAAPPSARQKVAKKKHHKKHRQGASAQGVSKKHHKKHHKGKGQNRRGVSQTRRF